MGLFQFLRGNKSTSESSSMPSIGFTATTSLTSHYVEVRQKTRGQLPAISIDAWDGYISPSGGFINYGCFEIKGKNKETNRRSSRYIEARTEEDACKYAEEKGLIGPYTVSVRPASPPTDAQISYAHSLGAEIPEGACSLDVSAIISRITDNDESAVSEGLARKAHRYGLKISRYTGRSTILRLAHDLSIEQYLELTSMA